MAVFRKLLKNRAGDTIIPVVDVVNYLYPVGSIYMSATMSTVAQVQEALGGTWEAWGAGKVPVGVDTTQTEFNTVGKTGGEKAHTLVNNELPKLSGSATLHASETANIFYGMSGIVSGNIWHNGDYRSPGDLTYRTGANSWGGFSVSFGNDQAHNNLQPYITCYMYKRVA